MAAPGDGSAARWLPVALVAVVLLVAAVVPRGGGPSTLLLGVGLDKYRHALGYGLFAWTFAVAVRGEPRPRTAALVVGVTLAYGLGTELLQLAVPSRGFSLLDLVADGVGAVSGVGLWTVGES